MMRETVFKVIFQSEFTGDDPEDIVEEHMKEWFDEKLRGDTLRYVRGIKSHRGEIDRIVSSKLENWTMDRLSAVDRNILRLGTYELLYEMDVPIEVTIDEMIEIAKKYGTDNSGKFVNGVLDRIAKEYAPEEKKEL